MKQFNYENKIYLKKLNELKLSYYSKYIRYIEKYLTLKSSKFLDVGCGNGSVLKFLKENKYSNGYGVDISRLFIQEGKSKNLSNLYYYNGIDLPFDNNFFDLIGSFNVLEHTQNPESFLKEEITKLKKRGIIIVACPNFLSVLFPSYHYRLKGIIRKLKNLYIIFNKLIRNDFLGFEKMKPIVRKKFQYDDDAIVVTNLIDLRKVLIKNRCEIIYESGFINYDTLPYRMLNKIPFLKYLLPSCFIVAQKIK